VYAQVTTAKVRESHLISYHIMTPTSSYIIHASSACLPAMTPTVARCARPPSPTPLPSPAPPLPSPATSRCFCSAVCAPPTVLPRGGGRPLPRALRGPPRPEPLLLRIRRQGTKASLTNGWSFAHHSARTMRVRGGGCSAPGAEGVVPLDASHLHHTSLTSLRPPYSPTPLPPPHTCSCRPWPPKCSPRCLPRPSGPPSTPTW
jgi:hypothetical protein